MGCFLACFGSSKDKDRQRRRRHKILPGDQRHGSYEPLKPVLSLNQESKETSISSVLEQRDKPEQQLSFSTRKKVTFDLNVKTYENVAAPQTSSNCSWENDEDKERGKEEEKRAKASQSLSASEDDSVTSSLGSYPPNHRYQNCRDSDDEDEKIDFSESDLDEDDEDDEEDDGDYDGDDDEPIEYKPESSVSFLSLPMESRTRACATLPNDKEVKRSMPICGSTERELKTLPLNQNARDRSKYVQSVLNPVENLSQWKAVKAKPRAATPPLKNQKENGHFEQETQIPFNPEPTSKVPLLKSSQSFSHSRHIKQETAVDASLSNWLGYAETIPTTQTRPFTFATESAERSRPQRPSWSRSPEDRPILGALTVEEMKQLSASSSSRRSPTRSPDEIPILGTMGSYKQRFC
ncbi:rRNA biogenesis protein rrp36-like [Macadamia integrifolia]|uniref:rRNA biogenesis protein rrp36-like n=1 Tax=Macadamia integrifolia TaxID=60698 RepID=UPI001C4F6963|nr:rRNA biogenesis protein rrp36-like [Macadamia integrifolia]